MIVEHGPVPLKGGVTTLMHVGDEPAAAPSSTNKWIIALAIGAAAWFLFFRKGAR